MGPHSSETPQCIRVRDKSQRVAKFLVRVTRIWEWGGGEKGRHRREESMHFCEQEFFKVISAAVSPKVRLIMLGDMTLSGGKKCRRYSRFQGTPGCF